MGNSGSRLELLERLASFHESSGNPEEFLVPLFLLDISVDDVYEVLTPEVIRGIRKEHPRKLVDLLTFSVNQIYEVYQATLSRTVADTNQKIRLLNSVRFISRISPFINDTPEMDEFMQLLWRAESFPRSIDEVDPESTGYGIIGAIMRSAFIRGFSLPASSLPPNASVDPNRIDKEVVWGRGGGIGGIPLDRSTVSTSRDIVETRVEIVRMALTVLSGPLFQSMGEYRNQIPIFNSLMSSGDFVHTANFFLSLIITVLDYQTNYYSIPLVSTALTSEDTSPDERLASNALNLINVLVDPPNRNEEVNVFREMLSSGISDEDEIHTLTKLLKNKVLSLYVANKALGLSYTYHLRNKSAFVLFLFNLLTLSTGRALLDDVRRQWGIELVLAMMSLISANVSDPSQVGLVHTCSFILLKLSADRDFVLDVFQRIYKGEIQHNIPPDVSKYVESDTRLADMMFVVIFKLILTRSKDTSESLAEMWITVLCNISSFVGGGLSPTAAGAFVSTLERMSRPGWLLGKPLRHHCVAFLLETVNNILQYQYESSSNFVYELVLRGPKIIENLESVGDKLHVYNDEWQERNLMEPLRRLVGYLGPRIEEECAKQDLDDKAVLALIKQTSLVGILPVPHSIVVRQFQSNEQTRLWFSSFLFGTVFVSLQSMPILDWSRVRMVTLSGLKRENSASADLDR